MNRSYHRRGIRQLLGDFLRSFSSIYGIVVMVIAILSVVLFLSFGAINRAVNKEYMENTIQENGNNVCMLVEGALYQHMLENDRTALKNTLALINKMPGIEDVNMYDDRDNLVHSSYVDDSTFHSNPNCKDCHLDINTMFPGNEKSYRIINMESQCDMSPKDYSYRLLVIRSPIINEPSCYTAACHAHDEKEEVLGSLVIRIPLKELDVSFNRSIFLAILATLLLATIFVWFTRLKIKNPLTAIIQASDAVSRGDRSTRLDVKANQLNDMRRVSLAFNEMLDSLHSASKELKDWSQHLEDKVQQKSEELSEMQNELIRIERIASLGKLSSSVAHEINNPLSGVLTYTKLVHKRIRKLLKNDPCEAAVLKYLKVIEEETKRCGDIVKGLLDFSRKDQLDDENRHLNQILRDVFTLMEHQMKLENINFSMKLKANRDLVHCGENQIKQACVALLMNASEAVLANGEIQICTSNPDEKSIRIEISDNGVGIDPEDIPHIFEPFYSAKEKARGIGLGLAIVHGIVESHGGKIEVKSELGKGTTMSILLPLVENQNE